MRSGRWHLLLELPVMPDLKLPHVQRPRSMPVSAASASSCNSGTAAQLQRHSFQYSACSHLVASAITPVATLALHALNSNTAASSCTAAIHQSSSHVWELFSAELPGISVAVSGAYGSAASSLRSLGLESCVRALCKAIAKAYTPHLAFSVSISDSAWSVQPVVAETHANRHQRKPSGCSCHLRAKNYMWSCFACAFPQALNRRWQELAEALSTALGTVWLLSFACICIRTMNISQVDMQLIALHAVMCEAENRRPSAFQRGTSGALSQEDS